MEPVTIRGRYLWRGNERFQVNGVVYQLRGDTDQHVLGDYRADELCRDIALFTELGINTVLVYAKESFDTIAYYGTAMKLLEDAGIYVLLVLSSAKTAINRSDPASSYASPLLKTFSARLTAMASYPNTLGVLVGSQIINKTERTPAAPYIRAVVRDLKLYMALAANESNQRILPIGYATSGSGEIARNVFDYLAGGDPQEAVDFFGLNVYSWVGESSFETSGYRSLMQRFEDTPIPLIFTEYGADVKRPRTFHETACIYSPEMTKVLSGAIVYEFFQGANQYGLVKVKTEAEEREHIGSPSGITLLEDFRNLKARLAESRCQELATDSKWVDEGYALARRPSMPQQSDTWLAGTRLPVPAVGRGQLFALRLG